jgi:dTDP-4-amino-4,6-dideoxygalactose transaminase
MTSAGQLALDGAPPVLAPGHPASGLSASSLHDDVFGGARLAARAEHPGHLVGRLERFWRDLSGSAHSIATPSGATALRRAVASLDIGPGDEVIVPADAPELACVLALDEIVAVRVDLDPRTLHVDPVAVEAAITDRTQAVVAVDRYGTTANYGALDALRCRYGLAIIEDASHSLGATCDSRPVGSLGDVSVCTLDGDDRGVVVGCGLLATDDDAIAAAARLAPLVNADPLGGLDGVLPGQGLGLPSGSASGSGWVGQIPDLGAALGIARLRPVEEEAAAGSSNGAHLRDRLWGTPGLWIPAVERRATHVYTSFPLLVVPDELGLPEATTAALRDAVDDALTAEGLDIEPWTRHTHTHPHPDPAGEHGCPAVDHLLEAGIVLGCRGGMFGPTNGLDDMERIAACIHKLFVDNVDRLRQLTLQRTHVHVMI